MSAPDGDHDAGVDGATEESSESRFDPERAVASLPTSPGVYLMIGDGEKVLYVGKAASLRDRVRSYFREGGDGRLQIPHLASRIRRIDHVVTATEKDALLLENNLIKQHKPRFNVRLKDDKTYVNLVLSTAHAFPRIYVRRRPSPGEGRIYGPYASASAVRETVKQITKIFQLRTCTDHVLESRVRPCLLYQLKRCSAPCVGHVDAERYAQDVGRARMFLEGRSKDLVRDLRARMEAASEALEFERAAKIRDQIFAVERTLEKQMVTLPSRIDRDVFGLWRAGARVELGVLNIRKGNLIGQTTHTLPAVREEDDEIWASLLLQYYDGSRPVPREIVVPRVPADAGVVEQILAERREGRVKITSPRRGPQRRLLAMARKNAASAYHARADADLQREETLEELQRRLRLRNAPRRIECFDISNISTTYSVASMVRFRNGVPDNQNYPRYRIRTVKGQDDFASMAEVVRRRYSRILLEARARAGDEVADATQENPMEALRRLEKGWESEDEGQKKRKPYVRLPDLVIVDGGKGQL
ncbi:MAG: excinuclease ABC subunit UvrC, partial [Myxococcales bacterium]|nr:excinuclease ABC subunit UvrC [Myxococcales bacterium]